MHRVSVDIVEDYMNLRVHIDDNMDGIKNIEALYKKNQSHLYFLRKRRSLNIWWTMLRMLYELPVALPFVVSQWRGGEAELSVREEDDHILIYPQG